MKSTSHFRRLRQTRHNKRRTPARARPPRLEPLEPRILFSTVFGDFNGDGHDDLAVGIAGEDLGVHTDAGAVQIFYSHTGGVVATDTQLWRQNSLGKTNDAGDRFGAALAAGDFNGDGYGDLAIGVPGEDVGPIVDAGAVHVLYGSRDVLTTVNSQYWDQDQPGIINRADPYDHFGQSLTVGNFNGDINRDTYLSIDDLVIGVPGEDQGRVTADSIRIAKFNNAGALHVIYGDPTGLVVRPGTDQFFHQARADLGNAPSRYDDFAAALAAGDFNGDARDDLAVGVPLANVNGLPDAGLIQILFAGSTGISANDRVYHQDKPGIEDRAEAYDHYGASLAAGRADDDHFADLAVGIPGEDLLRSGSIIYDSGAVNVMYGTGFDQFGIYDDQRLIQQARTRTRLDLAGNPESFDHFGGLFNDGRINDTLPILSSDPTATRHLYLDFNGHFQHEFGRCVTNNLGSDHCSRNVYTPPFDIDGDTTTFNRTEQELMLDIWLHVAEDFAPFNINVTTDASWFNDGTKPKPRVAIGGRSTDWYENEPSVSGVNRSGRNKDHFQNVVYVFSRSFFGGVYTDWDLAAAVGSTASHEAGHWYGLNHKGDYTPGSGRDEKYSRAGQAGHRSWVAAAASKGRYGPRAVSIPTPRRGRFAAATT